MSKAKINTLLDVNAAVIRSGSGFAIVIVSNTNGNRKIFRKYNTKLEADCALECIVEFIDTASSL